MTVSERIREVGLLRAAGARRGQVMSFMLTQALVLGVAGSLARARPRARCSRSAMVAFVRTVGSVTLERPALPLDAIVIALIVGVGVTLAAALEPARRASRIQPVEALTPRLDRPAARAARLRWLAVVFGAVALVGVVVLPRGAAGAGVVQALVVYAILLVATLLIPFVLPAIVRVAGAPFAAIFRFEERLARSSVVRDRSRTALTLGSLTIGLAMIVALGGVGEHARAAAAGWISDVVPGDLVVTSIRPIATDDGVAEDLAGRRPGDRAGQPDRDLRHRPPRDADRCGRGGRCRHGGRWPAALRRRRPRRRPGGARCRRCGDRPGRRWPSGSA